MSTIAVILVNVDDLDEYMGNMSDEEFDKKSEEYIRDEVERGNFFDTRIRYVSDENDTEVCVSTTKKIYWSKIVNGKVVDVDGTENTP